MNEPAVPLLRMGYTHLGEAGGIKQISKQKLHRELQ